MKKERLNGSSTFSNDGNGPNLRIIHGFKRTIVS